MSPAPTTALQDTAQRHLWTHFARPRSPEQPRNVPIMVRGEGCHVWDEQGKRYFDGLSALFCVNVGHGRTDIARAGLDQAEELAFFPNWGYATPPSIELAAKIASLAPGDLNRVFLTSGGSEAVESAIKLVRQYHKLTGHPLKSKIIARETAYHGTTMGALAATGIAAFRTPFEPTMPGGCHVPNTNMYRLAPGTGAESFAEAIAERILFEGPGTGAAVILEPVQNAGGCFVPPPGYFQRVREICDEHDVLLISDEVICSWGRLGEWFGADRFGYQPDIITTAKGITSAYAPLGAVIASDRMMQAFIDNRASFAHGLTFGGHPMCAAVALANIAVMEDEQIVEHARAQEANLHAMLNSLRDIPIVGDVRGAGYFWAIELVKDAQTRQRFSAEECERLLRGYLADELFDQGLICRADNRGDPVVQLAPPLIAGPEEFAEMEGILRPALGEASFRMGLAG